MNLLKRVGHFLQSEDGPTAVEYAVMIALIVIVCFVSIGVLGVNTNSIFNTASNAVAS